MVAAVAVMAGGDGRGGDGRGGGGDGRLPVRGSTPLTNRHTTHTNTYKPDGQCSACDETLMYCPAEVKGMDLTTLPLQVGVHRFKNFTDVPYIKECPYQQACTGTTTTATTTPH